KMPETHILRSQIDRGSNILLLLGDVHAAACGLQSKGCGPSMHPRGFSTVWRDGAWALSRFFGKKRRAQELDSKKPFPTQMRGKERAAFPRRRVGSCSMHLTEFARICSLSRQTANILSLFPQLIKWRCKKTIPVVQYERKEKI
ncbi:MAG: hypothetical protein IKP72_05320, partial [Clostridia bacterium]|nr:hypothetical protein [Clostridia bacterium]